jgi:hypothetical protein
MLKTMFNQFLVYFTLINHSYIEGNYPKSEIIYEFYFYHRLKHFVT